MVRIDIQYLYRYYTIPYILSFSTLVIMRASLTLRILFILLTNESRLAMTPENSLVIFTGLTKQQTGCANLETLIKLTLLAFQRVYFSHLTLSCTCSFQIR